MQQVITPWSTPTIAIAPASAITIDTALPDSLEDTMSKVMTPEQLKAKFQCEGKTFTDWARERGCSRTEVYKVVNGFSKCTRGKGHKIAVELGLKADACSKSDAA